MSRDFGVPVVSQGEYCFISYNAKDHKRVGSIVQALHAEGVPVWYDKGIDYGSNYHKVIAEKIESCSCFLLLFTKRVLEKEENSYVYKEYEMARLANKPIFVVMLDEVAYDDVPYSLKVWYLALNNRQNFLAYENTTKQTIQNIVDALPIKRLSKDGIKDTSPRKIKPVLKWGIVIVTSVLLASVFFVLWYLSTIKGVCGENLSWHYHEGVLTISGSGEMEDFSYNNMPWMRHQKDIKEIVVEEGVKTIGSQAFHELEQLAKVSLPEGLSFIGYEAFSSCNTLKSISIPDSVTEMDSHAFAFNRELSEVKLSENLTAIPRSCFYACSALTSISIPDSVISIGEHGFDGCTSLEKIIFTGSKAPEFGAECFNDVVGTIYYPASSSSWNQVVIDYYSGNRVPLNLYGKLNWIPY